MAKTKEAMAAGAGGAGGGVSKEEMTQLRIKMDKQEK